MCWILLLLSSAKYAGAGGVYWVPDADGQWTVVSNWSSTPALPGATDDVTISLSGDRLITLSGTATQTVNSVSSDERVTISQATLQAKLVQFSNTLTLTNGGTLRGGTYTSSGGATLSVLLGGTLDGLTVNGAIDTTAVSDVRLRVLNGLTLNGTMGVGGADGGASYVSFGQNGAVAGTLGGTGTIVFGGSLANRLENDSNQLGANGTLTIGTGITIRGKSGSITSDNPPGTIRNQGTIRADVSGGTFTIGNSTNGTLFGTFVNEGTLSAAAGTTLTINGAWSNTPGGTVTATGATLNLGSLNDPWESAGAIVVTDSTVNLGGPFPQPRSFVRSGGTVNIQGTLTGDLALDSGTGSWNLSTIGTIRNGRYSATGGSSLIVRGGTLDGVSVGAGAVVDATSSFRLTLRVLNGLVVDGTVRQGSADASTYAILYLGRVGSAAGALTGAGEVLFGGSGGNQIINDSNQIDQAGTLTFGPDLTIHGKSGSVVNGYATGTIVNRGTISADVAGGTITLGSNQGTFVNYGTLSAASGATLTLAGDWKGGGTLAVNGGTLNLGGMFTEASYGTFNRSGGTVNLTGVLTGDLSLSDVTGSWNLITGGTLRGGTYNSGGGAALLVDDGVLDGVTVNGTVDVTTTAYPTLRVLNGMTLNSTISVGKADGSTYGAIYMGDTATTSGTLGGNGTILFGGNTIDGLMNASDQMGEAGTLTIGKGITIRGKSGRIFNASPNGTIVNQGAIRAEVAGGEIGINKAYYSLGRFTNQGAMSAANGGTLTVWGDWHNGPTGTIAATDSTLNLGNGADAWDNAGSINVTNSTVNLGGMFAQANLGKFVRKVGTVNVTGTLTGDLALDQSTGSWNVPRYGMIRNGTYTATDGASLHMTGGILDGVTVNAPLTGALQVLNGLVLNTVMNPANADGTSAGSMTFGGTGETSGALTGNGTVILGGAIVNGSDQIGAAGTLTIGEGITIRGKGGIVTNDDNHWGATIVNRGTIAADVAGGKISVGNGVGALINQGTMSASGGGTLAVTGPWTNAGVVTVNNGTLNLTGSVSGSGPISLNVANVSLVSDPGGSKPSLDTVTVTGDTTITLSRPYKADPTFHIANLSLGGNRLTVTGGVSGGALEIGDVGLSGTATVDLSQPVTVTGVIAQDTPGRGIIKSGGSAKLTLAGTGANTFSGVTRVDVGALDLNKADGVIAVPGDLSVQGGTVKLLAAGQIAPASNVVVSNPGAVLDLGGHSQTYASLSISNSAQVLVRATAGASAAAAVNGGTAVLRVNGSLVVSGGGVLNMGNNRLIVDYDSSGASPMPNVRAALATGYSGGTWQGPGINATVIGGDRGLGYAEASDVLGVTGGTFAGQSVDGSAVLVRYTLSGDANLDGVVDFNDLVKLAQNYSTTVAATGSGWYRGDFNYDGSVDFQDLVKLAQNYNAALPTSAIPSASERFDADLAAASANVPEPRLLGLFGLCLLIKMARRRGGRRSLGFDR